MKPQPTILLGDLMASRLGSVDPSEFVNEEFDLYSIPAFDSGQPEIRLGGEIGSTKQVIQPGDVLLSKIVPHIRRSWIVGEDRGRRIIGSGEWIVFRSTRIDPGYLRHVLVGDPFHHEFMQTVSGVGGSLLRARPSYVANIRIPLPPLPEQRRIAAILDQAEALRTQRRAAVAKLDTLAQSIFIEMFGDPVLNERQWQYGRVSRFIAGFETGKNLVAEDSDTNTSQYRVLKISAVTSLKYMPMESKALPAGYLPPVSHIVRNGDMLFSRANTTELIGATVLIESTPPDIVLPDKLWRVIWNQLEPTDPHWVLALFRAKKFRYEIGKRATGTSGSMKNISQEKVFSIEVGLPPVGLQRAFGERYRTIEKLIKQHRSAIEILDALFASLQHRAFRGKL